MYTVPIQRFLHANDDLCELTTTVTACPIVANPAGTATGEVLDNVSLSSLCLNLVYDDVDGYVRCTLR